MVEKGRKGRKIGLFQPSKSPKIPEKSRQNRLKSRQNDGKGRQNTGGWHPLRYRGRAELVTACHRFDSARRGGGASSARRGLSGAICPAGRGAAALSYIAMWGGGVRSPTGAASSARRAVQIGGIIGPARGCPVLYSYVGRRGVAAVVWRAVLLSGAGMMCGRGAAVLSYIAM